MSDLMSGRLELVKGWARLEVICPHCEEPNWVCVKGRKGTMELKEHHIQIRCHHPPFGCGKEFEGTIHV